MANKYFNVKTGIKSGNVTLDAASGNANLGNITSTGVVSAVDLILSGNVRSNLRPNVTNVYSLGSSSYAFTDLFVANAVVLDGQTIVGNTTANTVVISGNVILTQANVATLNVTTSANVQELKVIEKTTTANLRVSELANIENILIANQASFSNGISVAVLATLHELKVTTTANTANLTVTNTATIENLSANTATVNTIAVNTQLVINSTTDSTTTDTGSIIVKGGVGIEKDLTVGGNINLATPLNKTPKAGINYNDGADSIDFGFK